MSDPAVTTAWVRAFIDELARAGVEHVCIAPGSRSTPLVMACAREDRIQTWVHLDERCAGFFALGLGKVNRRPAAVITTSGTATANLFPAVIEASLAGVPLLALTADRPYRLRGTDANQTIDQTDLYGSFVRKSLDAGEPSAEGLRGVRALACEAVNAAVEIDPGPVHVNFPLDKPLEPAELTPEMTRTLRDADGDGLDGRADGSPMAPVARAGEAGPPRDEVSAVAALLDGRERGLIVAGPVPDPDAVGAAVGHLARATGFPVLADPLSGARFSEHCVEHGAWAYDLFLREAGEALEPDVVIRIGGAPTSTSLLDFLGELEHVDQVLVTSGHHWRDHLGVASLEVRAKEAPFVRAVTAELGTTGVSSPWCERWRAIDHAARQAVCDFRTSEGGELYEGAVLAAVVAAVPEGATLFASNSLPIRDLDAFGGGGKPLRVYGNRGASGIDGIVSTVAGMEAASGGPSPTVAVVGDVAFYHDMNGLLAVAERGLDVVFVVINNDGGGIFHLLPIREHEPEFTRYFATPHGIDFSRVAELYGISYSRVDHPNAAAEVLGDALAGTGPRILEVRSDRARNQQGRQAVIEAVRRAVSTLL